MNRVVEERICEGQWWVPGCEGDRLIGELFRGEAGELKLRFLVAGGFVKAGDQLLKIIHGLDEHAKPVTLFYGIWSGSHERAAITGFLYSIGYVFFGEHLNSWEEAVFDEVETELDYLSDWIAVSGFEIIETKVGESSIFHRLPENREFSSGRGFRLILAASSTRTTGAAGLASITEKWCLRLVYENKCAFKQIRDDLRAIRWLLSLGVGRKICEREFILRRSAETLWFSGRRLTTDIKCVTPDVRVCILKDRMHAPFMRFSLSKVDDCFEEVLMKWMVMRERLRDVLALFFSTEENSALYSNHVFLFLAQALEVYHRCCGRRYASAIEPKEKFEARKIRIFSKLNDEDAAWLKKKLGAANVPTLEMRLLEVLADKKKWLGELIPDPTRFAETVRNLRNKFTHWPDPKKRKKLDDDVELGDLSERMKRVLLVCFFSDLGLPDSIVERAARYCPPNFVRFSEEDEKSSPPTAIALLAPSKNAKRKKSTKRKE